MAQELDHMNYETEEELKIDLKKYLYVLLNRKELIITIFLVVLIIFILSTFFLAKKYTVSADIYINKTNSTNMAEFNPYILNEITQSNGLSAFMGGIASNLTNEIELMRSSLVMDKVIKDNHFVYGKKWGIIPNKKEGEYLPGKALAYNKNLSIEEKKGTKIITISFTSKKPDVSYNVVSSIIKYYTELYKDLNNERSVSDIKLLENEYKVIKADLEKKINKMNALPKNAMNITGNLSTISAYSTSAQKAMSSYKAQYANAEKSNLEVQEEAAKLAEIAKKIEWAKLVQGMSDASNIIILEEPKLLRDFEYSSPKLSKNILFGIIFGIFFAFLAIIIAELFDKKLTYSAIGDNIIYYERDNIDNLKISLLSESSNKIAFISLCKDEDLKEQFNIKNDIIKAEINEKFIKTIDSADKIILFEAISKTDKKLYQKIKQLLEKMNKPIIAEVLV